MGIHRAWIEVIDPERDEAVPVRWQDIISLNVELTLYMAANSFDITLVNSEFLSDYLRKEQEISIWVGTVADSRNWSRDELTHVFTGKIDGVRPRFANEMTVRLIGRDYAAWLIDSEFSVAFAERTASQIAEILAKKRKLKPVITPTTAIIEKDLYRDRKEWDILQELADREGFVCYVTKEKELYFGPRNEDDETIITELLYRQGERSNVSEIEFDDSMVGIINCVEIRHWLGKKKGLVVAIAENRDLVIKYGEKRRVYYDCKAKTQTRAQEIAQKRLKEWSRMVVNAEQVRMSLDPKVVPEKVVMATGFGRFDGKYYIDRVSIDMSKSGSTMTLDITSQRPDSAAQYRQDLYNYRDKTM